ncbi:MAG: hypothetical protein IKG01_14720 [Lachnospiraceae bacterium]|nr:hypothetical protein [Lachnospiraceae bacterium]
MDFSGCLTNISIDYKTGFPRLEFSADQKMSLASAEELQGQRLTISFKRYRQKRSLDANSYFHVLVGKIAEAVGTSLTEVKNHLLAEYGQHEIISDQLVPMIVRDTVDWQKLETVHLKPTSATRVLDDGKLYRVYYLMRGSHTFDTAEMARLIDGTVEEAKALGIETATPEEIAHMKELWHEKHH